MSAPDTSLWRQKLRHRGPLIGIAVVVAVILVMFFGLVGQSVDDPVPPGELPPGEADALTPAPDAAVPAEPEQVAPLPGD